MEKYKERSKTEGQERKNVEIGKYFKRLMQVKEEKESNIGFW